MENTEIRKTVQKTIRECANLNGWANLAEIGGQLREQGVKYKKLRRFMSNFDDLLEFRTDETVEPPVIYAKVKA